MKAKKTSLLLLALCLAALTLFSVGCKKNTGWKTQSAPGVSSSVPEQSTAKPTSFTVSSFLHDLFGGELPASTDRYCLPVAEEVRELDLPIHAYEGNPFGSSFYYLNSDDLRVFRLDLETGETSVFTDDVKNPRLVCTDTDGVYVYDLEAKAIAWFSFDGERLSSVPIPVEPHGGDGYISEFYAASLDHYDGLLLLALRDGIWTLADGDTEWKKTDLVLLAHETVKHAAIVSRSRLLVDMECFVQQRITYRLIEIGTDGKNERVLPSDGNQAVSINENRLFRVSSRGCRLYELLGDSEVYLRGLNGEGHRFNLASHIAVSGNSLLIFWYLSGRVTMLPLHEYDAVRIIAPESKREQADTMVNAAKRVSAQYQTYDDKSFIEKLTTALLSKNDEFEIALVTGTAEETATLLNSVIANRQYANLGENGTLMDHLNAAYPGVREMIEVNGQIALIPVRFEQPFYGFNAAAQDSFTLPAAAWTAEDLKSFGDAVRGSGFSIFSDEASENAKAVLSMAVSAVQANSNLLTDNIGSQAEEALNDLFSTLEKLCGDGCLFGGNPLLERVGLGVFDSYGVTKDSLTARFALLPSAVYHAPRVKLKYKPAMTGKQPLTVMEFLFVNPNSERAALALQFLAEMTSEDNRYNAGIWGSPLWPELSKYYRSADVIFDPETEEFTISPHREPAIQNVPPAYIEKLDAFLPDYYAGSELCYAGLTIQARQAVRNFVLGALSGEECARILYEELVYRVKG